MLLDETVGEQLAVHDLVAALRADIDEPAQHLQRTLFVVVAAGAHSPYRDVVIEQLAQRRLVSSLRSIAANSLSATSAMTC